MIAAVAGRAMGYGQTRAVLRMSSASMSFFDFSAKTIGGKTKSMADYKGKPVLILNVASL
jgi:hypothetical protein